ncbi:MAG: hypothetical protein KDG89_11410 [Geminicoccaceae bacterium]|nr:hypothetical protein [Geminicoccaceae bacterium]
MAGAGRRLGALAIFAVLLFNFPLLAVAERAGRGFVPFYLFAAWGLVIVLVRAFGRRTGE